MSYILPFLVLASALSIAGTAAYFSIVGLTALFPGALGPIIAMGTVLECGKLIAATWLHHNWYKCARLMRYYLTFSVVVLMGITSIGIFGFLAKSHLEHQKGALEEKALIEQLDEKIQFEQSAISQYKSNIEKLNTQISSFNNFKTQDIATEQKLLEEISKNLEKSVQLEQERINSFNARFKDLEAERLVIENGSSFSKRSKLEKLAEAQASERQEIADGIKLSNKNIDQLQLDANQEIKNLRTKIDSLRQEGSNSKDNTLSEIDKYNSLISSSQSKIDSFNTERFKFGDKLREIEMEVGPVKYVADLLSGIVGKEIAVDGAVKTLIITIIFVFDPLAVLLLLASTSNLKFKFLSPHEKLKEVAKWG